jgi:hypothetical protein
MMLPTHALGGMALGLLIGAFVPEFGTVALLAGFVGGVVPDLDMYAGHRKTLHFPVGYPIMAVSASLLAAAVPTVATVGVATGLLAAALHSLSDVLGGGLELRPWEGTSDRAVFDHVRGRWLAPRRWVGYDGSPGDLALSSLLAAPLLLTTTGTVRTLVLASLSVATLYATVRRRLPALARLLVQSILVPSLPDRWHGHVPDRYHATDGR